MVNCTGRSGFFVEDNNMDKIIRGSFIQPSGKSDYAIDYDVSKHVTVLILQLHTDNIFLL